MVQDSETMATERQIDDMRRTDREERDAEESYRDEQRRMWCVGTAVNLAIALQRAAPSAEALHVMAVAEEMNEFIETGVARNAKVSRKRQ